VSKAKFAIALTILSVATIGWAVPIQGTAPQRVQRLRPANVVAPIRLRDERERGLLAQGWINRDRHGCRRFACQSQCYRASAVTDDKVAQAAGWGI
jgi:hypothetical protein